MDEHKPTTRTLRMTLPESLYEALADEAGRRGVSPAALVREALAEWMRRELPPGRMPHERGAG